MIIAYNLFKEYFTNQTYTAVKRVKRLGNKHTKQQPDDDQMNCACEVYSTPIEKAKFVRWVVYTTGDQ